MTMIVYTCVYSKNDDFKRRNLMGQQNLERERAGTEEKEGNSCANDERIISNQLG